MTDQTPRPRPCPRRRRSVSAPAPTPTDTAAAATPTPAVISPPAQPLTSRTRITGISKRTTSKRTTSNRTSLIVRAALSSLLLLVLGSSGSGPGGRVKLIRLVHAERDGNAPWGDGRPPHGFSMWWRDPSNVLEDLDEFAALYVKAHGCVWSEYGIDDFDDDGENRDGDEDWYQGRTLPFRANVAYSLYGVLKGQFRINKCSKATYINTFVTFMGADALLNTIGRHGLGNDDDAGYGNAYCTQMDAYDLYGRDRDLLGDLFDRDLGSGDNNNNDNLISTTMGCAINSDKFVMAAFGNGYCDGNKFLNNTDDMRSYNRAMKNIRCEKIWDQHSTKYIGDELLRSSNACDSSYYGNRCPDPYGRKKRYAKMSSGGTSFTDGARRFFLYFVRGLAWILLFAGLLLLAAAFWIKRRYGRGRRRRSSRRKKSTKKSRSSRSSKRRFRGEGEDGGGGGEDDGTYNDDGTNEGESEYTGTVMSGESSGRRSRSVISGESSRRRSRSGKSKSSKSKSKRSKDHDVSSGAVDPEADAASPGRSRTSAVVSPKSVPSRSSKARDPASPRSSSRSSKSKRDKVRNRLGMDAM